MTIHEFTIQLFCRVDDAMTDTLKHPQALLYPSETVTLGLLFALKGGSNRAFYRWANANLRSLFPRLPERTRLFRLLTTHQDWTQRFLAQPSLLGVVDSYGIELIHPRRQGRSDKQIGKKGKSNHRWIVGAKLCFVLDHLGRVVAWDVNSANVYDGTFGPLIRQYEGQMLVLSDQNFHVKTTPEQSDPANLKVCKRGAWGTRILVETVLSMLTQTCRLKKVGHRLWSGLKMRLAFALAAFNVCVQWNGLPVDESGFVPLTMTHVCL